MKVSIDSESGCLELTPETGLELYALQHWLIRRPEANFTRILNESNCVGECVLSFGVSRTAEEVLAEDNADRIRLGIIK